MTYDEKAAKFREKVLRYLKSPKETEDLFRFAVAVVGATQHGCGLLFDDIEDIIDESFAEVRAKDRECGYCNGTGRIDKA